MRNEEKIPIMQFGAKFFFISFLSSSHFLLYHRKETTTNALVFEKIIFIPILFIHLKVPVSVDTRAFVHCYLVLWVSVDFFCSHKSTENAYHVRNHFGLKSAFQCEMWCIAGVAYQVMDTCFLLMHSHKINKQTTLASQRNIMRANERKHSFSGF